MFLYPFRLLIVSNMPTIHSNYHPFQFGLVLPLSCLLHIVLFVAPLITGTLIFVEQTSFLSFPCKIGKRSN